MQNIFNIESIKLSPDETSITCVDYNGNEIELPLDLNRAYSRILSLEQQVSNQKMMLEGFLKEKFKDR